jgi:anti-sigma B factor antagonist
MAQELPQVDTTVATEKVGDAYVIAVAGELDLYSTPLLVAELDPLIAEGPEVVLDLTGVSFVDSTALGAMLLGARRLKQMNGRLALVTPDPSTTKLLTMVGVDRVVPIFATTDAALQRD